VKKTRGKNTSPAPKAPPAPKPTPQQLPEWEQELESLPDEKRAMLAGLMTTNPGAVPLMVELRREAKRGAVFSAWLTRQRVSLLKDKKHKPVQAAYVGKAMVVRARVDSRNKHAISRPDIFGVFASEEASGVLEDPTDYQVAIKCAKQMGRGSVGNRASRALNNPITLLEMRGVLERSSATGFVRLAEGCQDIFEDPGISWPKPVPRSEYVTPKPRV